jgi:excisionase family DNA binding protein
LRVRDAHQENPIELPSGAVALLMGILEAMAAGPGVTIIPEKAELTTVQAAEVLNGTRPFLIKLLNEGAIPFRKVGKHRGILMEDVMSYKANIDRECEAVLDELTRDAQEQGMGYDRPGVIIGPCSMRTSSIPYRCGIFCCNRLLRVCSKQSGALIFIASG